MAELRQIGVDEEMVNENPSIKIGGVPILEQNFRWAKTAGVTPYSTFVDIPISLDFDMRQTKNPVDVEIKFRGGVGAQNVNKEKSFTIKKCFLHEPKVVSEFHVRWQLSDSRFLLRGQKCFFNYNEARIKNELGIASPQQLKSNIDTTPAALRAPFDSFARGRYVKPSIKSDNTPFSISEILKIEFAKKGFNVRFPGNISQLDYVMENIRAEGEDFYSCISSLLAKARMNVFMDFSGNLQIYSVDFFDQNTIQPLIDLGNRQKTEAGQFYMSDKRRERPSKVIVRFEKMVETMISFSDVDSSLREVGNTTPPDRKDAPAETKINNATTVVQAQKLTTIPCINVVQANFIPNNFLGTYNVGEYIEIGEYLRMLGFTKDELRRAYFSDLFANRLSQSLLGLGTEQLSLASAIASNVKNSFRQQFMVDPFYLDRIKRWEAKKVTIIDQFSGYRAPSPLFQDYFMAPRAKDIRGARGQITQKQTRSVFIDQFDPQRTKGTPGTIAIVNPDLGIFRTSYPPTTDSVILEVLPSALEDDVNVNPQLGGYLFTQANLSEDHTMETLVSVIWNYDDKDGFDSSNIGNSAGKYHDIEFDFSQGNAVFGPSEGPTVTLMCNREYARFDRNLNIVNNTIIDAVASAESGKMMNKFRDRFGGFLTVPDWIDFPIIGHMSSIIYSFSPNSGASTSFDATTPPFDPSIEQSVPENVRQYLYRQLNPRTGP